MLVRETYYDLLHKRCSQHSRIRPHRLPIDHGLGRSFPERVWCPVLPLAVLVSLLVSILVFLVVVRRDL